MSIKRGRAVRKTDFLWITAMLAACFVASTLGRPALADNEDPNSVRAPFTKVDSDGYTTTVRAPLTKVDTTQAGTNTRVRAPFCKVDKNEVTGDKRVRAPFVKIDRVGDQVHIRAPFVNKWMSAEEYDRKHAQEIEEERQEELDDQRRKREKDD